MKKKKSVLEKLNKIPKQSLKFCYSIISLNTILKLGKMLFLCSFSCFKFKYLII